MKKSLILIIITLFITSLLVAGKPSRDFLKKNTPTLKKQDINNTKKSDNGKVQFESTKEKDKIGRYYIIKSENFVLISYTKKTFANKVTRALEETRKDFIDLFKIKDASQLKATAIILKNRQDFNRYSDTILNKVDRVSFSLRETPRAAFWSDAKKTIVMYKMENKDAFFDTLSHELTHMFLHFLISKVPLWFNEGMACYMGAAEERFGTLRGESLDRDRLKKFQSASSTGSLIPLKELIKAEEYYNGNKKSLQYAESWALVFYLLHGKKGSYRKKFRNFFYSLIEDKEDLDTLYNELFGNYNDFVNGWTEYIDELNPNKIKIKKKLELP